MDRRLWYAAHRGDNEEIKTLLTQGANLEFIYGVLEQTPLLAAESNDHPTTVQLLVERGADVQKKDIYGWTCAHWASVNGNLELLKYLVGKGLSVDVTDIYGENCLHRACGGGHLAVITWLMEQGLSLYTPNKEGKTPLDVLNVEHELVSATTERRKKCLAALKTGNKDTADTGAERVMVNIVKGPQGFGFSLIETAQGPIVKKIMDVPRCAQLREGDLILEVNGEKVFSHSHSDLIALLKMCHKGNTTNFLIVRGFQSNAIPSTFRFEVVEKGIKQVNGKMKVARVLLHGAPQVGKTSIKRLIFNYPPLAEEDEQSTQLLEDPVRAISTCRMMSTDERNLEEIDETKLIKMIQMELKSHLSKRKEEETKRPAKHSSNARKFRKSDIESEITKKTMNLPKDEVSQTSSKMPEVLADIANNLDSIDPKITPPLFACQFAHLVDSGGQPQFSDLLPLVFQSESHHHIAVTPLNEKLNTKPQNCVNLCGKKEKLPDALLLTHFQLIERVCQFAKASESKIIIVGTHLDKEDEEEPLAEKNKLLKPLLEKYKGSLIPKDDESIVFAVNAMAPAGKERKEYAAMLQGLILDDFCSNEEKMVPLRWMALELELSRRSKKSGEIIEKAECNEIAKSLGISDLPGALAFFNEIAVLYYYPEAVPDIIFTSVGAISSRLSKIVETSFLSHARNRKDLRLQEKGELSLQYLFQLLSKAPKIKCFTTDDFVQLIKHLRIVFSIDDHTLFIPSLLPVDPKKEKKLDCYHPEPLVFYWYDSDYQELRIFPQSFFHALIVELLRRKEIIRLSKAEQTRSDIVLTLTLESKKECLIRLVSQVFWMEAFAEKRTFASDDISYLTEIIQKSSRSILQQLKLAGTFGDLQYGLLCPKKECGKELSHLCTSAGTSSLLKCLEDEHCKWEEEDSARLFWIKHLEKKGLSSSSGVTVSRPPATVHGVTGTIAIKAQQIHNRTHEPAFQRAQGIIFIVGVYGADGTAKDVENVEATFKDLNFAVYTERDPPSSHIACLARAAAICQYPYRYKYIGFYFAGHGGRDQSNGKLFIKGLQLDESDPKILHIEEFIVQPLKEIKRLKKLCLFDCCQAPGNGRAYRDGGACAQDLKPVPGMLIAYSSSKGQKSFGDNTKGGIWTYHLCMNLRQKVAITEILAMTSNDVAELKKKEFQDPMTVCSEEFHSVILHPDSLPIQASTDDDHSQSSRSSSSGSEEVKSKPGASKIEEKTTTTGSSEKVSQSSTEGASNATVILSHHPELQDAYSLTRCRSSKWNDLGRMLKVSYDYREHLHMRIMSEEDKLEAVLHKWIESECSPVTWSNLIHALENIQLMDVARDVKKFLNIPDSDESHLSRDKDSKAKANTTETTRRSIKCCTLL